MLNFESQLLSKEQEYHDLLKMQLKALQSQLELSRANQAQLQNKLAELQKAYSHNLEVINNRDEQLDSQELRIQELDKQLLRKDSIIKELQSKIEQLRQKRGSHQSEKVKALQSQLEDLAKENERIKLSFQSYKNQQEQRLAAIRQSNQNAEYEIKQIALSASTRIRAQQKLYERQVSQVNLQKQLIQKNCEEAKSKLKQQLKATQEQLLQQKQTLFQQQRSHNAEIASLRTINKEQEFCLSDLESQLQFFKKESHSWETALKDKIKEQEQQVEHLTMEMSQSKQRFKQKVRLLKDECAKRIQDIEESALSDRRRLESQNRAKVIQCQRRAAQQAQLEEKISELNQQLRGERQSKQSVNSELISRLQEDKRYFKSELQKRQAKIRQLLNQFKLKDNQLEMARNSVRQADKAQEDKQRAIQDLNQQIAQLKDRLKEKEKKNNSLESDILFRKSYGSKVNQQEVEEYRQAIASMTRQMQMARQKVQLTVQQRNITKEQSEILKRKLTEREEEVFRLKEQSLEQRSQIQKLQIQIQRGKLQKGEDQILKQQLQEQTQKVQLLEQKCSQLNEACRNYQDQIESLESVSHQLRYQLRVQQQSLERSSDLNEYISSIKERSQAAEVISNIDQLQPIVEVRRQQHNKERIRSLIDAKRSTILKGSVQPVREVRQKPTPVKGRQVELHERERSQPKTAQLESQRAILQKIKQRKRQEKDRQKSIEQQLRKRYFGLKENQ